MSKALLDFDFIFFTIGSWASFHYVSRCFLVNSNRNVDLCAVQIVFLLSDDGIQPTKSQ